MTRMSEEERRSRDELLAELRAVKVELQRVSRERDEAMALVGYADEIVDLKRKIVDLEIRSARITEDHQREKREVTHMVGLEKKRQEFEIDQAKRETTVTVREENLTADRARFEQQMTFTTERFGAEVGYLKDLMGEILDRLPTVTIDRSIPSIEERRAAATS